MFDLQSHIDIAPEVADALASNAPLVALESTIIAHGMPYPENVETARSLEAIIREEGAVPATLAVINGRIKIGLTEAELHILATDGNIAKASRRDLAYYISQKRHAATTVAATMILAQMGGIKIFATGGIGGVHRGAAETFDVSADLTELARTPVAVVSAGAKAILDLGLTLEYLETQGVPVIGVGTDEFPAFFSRESGFAVPMRLDTAEEIGRMIQTHWGMGLSSGLLIANPIPEADSLPKDVIMPAIEQALEEAVQQGITGKETTPFLLSRVKSLTAGVSLVSNIALVKNNARLAARVAVTL
jgi:pseudouridine-5'-phosphate glycosidase